MQDVQNIPNPDVTTTDTMDDFGSHSALEQDLDNDDIENPKNTDAEPTDPDTKTRVEQPPNIEGNE